MRYSPVDSGINGLYIEDLDLSSCPNNQNTNIISTGHNQVFGVIAVKTVPTFCEIIFQFNALVGKVFKLVTIAT